MKASLNENFAAIHEHWRSKLVAQMEKTRGPLFIQSLSCYDT